MIRRYGLYFALFFFCVLMYGMYLGGWIPVGEDNTLGFCPYFSLPWDVNFLPPLWKFYSQGGSPLDDNFVAVLYPPRLPAYFCPDWRAIYGPYWFFHYFVAFFGMALFLRSADIDRLSAFTGAVVFAAGGHLAGRILNPTILMSVVWFPWLLYGAAGEGRARRFAATGALVLLYLAAQPQSILYGTLVYAIALLVLTPSAARRRAFAGGAVSVGTAFLAASPELIPGAIRVLRSSRMKATAGVNLADSLDFSEIPNILFGGSGGSLYPEYIDKICYVSPVILALILWAMCYRVFWRRREVVLGIVFFWTGIFIALGKNAGWEWVFSTVPGLRMLSGPTRALTLSALGLSLLAAFAMRTIRERANASESGKAFAAPGLIFAALGGACFLYILTCMGFHLESIKSIGGVLIDAWLSSPPALNPSFFPFIDAGLGLLVLGAGIFLLGFRFRRAIPWFAAGLAVFMLWNFRSRVDPPLERASFFTPPAGIDYLQKLQRRPGAEPFRVAGFDALRFHDSDLTEIHKFENLMPNLAGCFGLEDIQTFDTLIELDFLDLLLRTAGRCRFNDPLRSAAIAKPDLELFDTLGVRYLIGHPYNRLVSAMPLTVHPSSPVEKPVPEWNEEKARDPITAWLFVSLADGNSIPPAGAAVAALIVEAEEGRFEYPVRIGVETHHLLARNYASANRKIPDRESIHMAWTEPTLDRSFSWRVKFSQYRGRVCFDRPLHVKKVSWKPLRSDTLLHVSSQACRLARPAEGLDPWRLVFGEENQVAPVFEYIQAKPRAELRAEDSVSTATVPGTVSWLAKTPNTLRLRCQTDKPALLYLRERWASGWRATVNGKPEPIIKTPGGFRAVRVPAGTAEVFLSYQPGLFLALSTLSALVLLCWLAVALRRRCVSKDALRACG